MIGYRSGSLTAPERRAVRGRQPAWDEGVWSGISRMQEMKFFRGQLVLINFITKHYTKNILSFRKSLEFFLATNDASIGFLMLELPVLIFSVVK